MCSFGFDQYTNNFFCINSQSWYRSFYAMPLTHSNTALWRTEQKGEVLQQMFELISPFLRLSSAFPFVACKCSFITERPISLLLFHTPYAYPHYLSTVFQLNLRRKAQTVPFLLMKSCPKPAANPSLYSLRNPSSVRMLKKVW